MKPVNDQALLEMRAEIFRLVRLCAPNLANLGAITFAGMPSDDRQRLHWRDTIFAPVLAPAVRSAWAAGTQGFREMCAADATLDAKLAGPLSKTSRATGRLIAASLHAPAGEHGLEKFLAAVSRGESPGHMAVVFAARAAVFHFTKDVVIAGLVFAELRNARIDELWRLIDDCLSTVSTHEPSIFRDA